MRPLPFVCKGVTQVVASYGHSACVAADGALYTWGHGAFGNLGHGDAESTAVPTRVQGSLSDTRVVQVDVGNCYSACIDAEGALYTWGHGRNGKLGHGHMYDTNTPTRVEDLCNTKVAQVATGAAHTACITEKGALFTWGSDCTDRLGHSSGSGSGSPAPVSMRPWDAA